MVAESATLVAATVATIEISESASIILQSSNPQLLGVGEAATDATMLPFVEW